MPPHPTEPVRGSVVTSPSATTPGNLATRSSMSWYKRRIALSSWYLGSSAATCIVTMWWVANPGGTACKRTKLRKSSPPPISSTSESASSPTTSNPRNRCRRKYNPPALCALRPPAFFDVVWCAPARPPPRLPPYRRQAEQNSRQQRNAERERQHRSIHPDVLESRNIPRIHGAHDVQARARNSEARHTTKQSQQHALGQQLPRQPPPARPQRRADRHLFLAPCRAGEQQIRHVGASDQQHHRHRAQQHQQRLAHVAHHFVLQPHDVHAETGVAFVFFANPRGDHIDIGLRLLHRHARLEPHDNVVILVVPAVPGLGGQRERQKHVHLIHRRFRGHDLGVQQESAL